MHFTPPALSAAVGLKTHLFTVVPLYSLDTSAISQILKASGSAWSDPFITHYLDSLTSTHTPLCTFVLRK